MAFNSARGDAERCERGEMRGVRGWGGSRVVEKEGANK